VQHRVVVIVADVRIGLLVEQEAVEEQSIKQLRVASLRINPPNDIRVSQLRCPHHGRPTAFILGIDKAQKAGDIPRGSIALHNQLSGLHVAQLGCNMQTCLAIGTLWKMHILE